MEVYVLSDKYMDIHVFHSLEGAKKGLAASWGFSSWSDYAYTVGDFYYDEHGIPLTGDTGRIELMQVQP